jgi:hypothetical protein
MILRAVKIFFRGLNHPRQEPLVFNLIILQQIDSLIIGPNLKIEIVFSIPTVQDLLNGKSPFQQLKGNRTFWITIAGVTGDLHLKPLMPHPD